MTPVPIIGTVAYMTTTRNLITTDQGDTFAIEATTAAGPNIGRYGWTHMVCLRRPKGRKLFSAFAVIENGEIARLSSVSTMGA